MQLAKPYQLALLVFIVLGVYYPALFASFCSVDDQLLANTLLNLEEINLFDIFIPQGSGTYYRPLLSLMYMLDKYIWELQPSFMHLTNVCLHVVNVLLVYWIAARLAAIRQLEAPFFPLAAALLFALHPINTESVLWISGRTDLLSCLFILWSFLTLLAAEQRQSLLLISLAAFLFFVSTLAKDSAIFWYPGIIFYLYCTTMYTQDNKINIQRLMATISAFTCVPLAYFLIRRMAFSKGDSGIATALQGVSAGASFDWLLKLKIILKTLGFYLKKIIWPFPLNFTIVSISDWYIILGLVVILLTIYLLYRRQLFGSLYLMAICLALPALFVSLTTLAWTPLAERYLYMSASFFSIAISLFALVNYRQVVAKPFIGACLTLGFVGIGYACHDRAVIWQDNATLFTDCVNKSPGFAPVKNELAVALKTKGRFDEANQILMANSLQNSDKYSIIADMNRATVMASRNDVAGAIILLKSKNYDSSRPLYKEYLEKMLQLNGVLAKQTDPDSRRMAEIKKENLDYVMKLHSFTGDPIYYYQLGQMNLADGNRADARRYFMLAAINAPQNAFYRAAAAKMADKLR